MSKPQTPSLTLKRRLGASAQKVFAAWTDPEKIVHWFGPAETASGSVQADMDVRVGGRYRIRFQTGAYFSTRGEAGFFPVVEIQFSVHDGTQHYHVPLLLSPFGFSTYRGS